MFIAGHCVYGSTLPVWTQRTNTVLWDFCRDSAAHGLFHRHSQSRLGSLFQEHLGPFKITSKYHCTAHSKPFAASQAVAKSFAGLMLASC
jgi:hypothetical protein